MNFASMYLTPLCAFLILLGIGYIALKEDDSDRKSLKITMKSLKFKPEP